MRLPVITAMAWLMASGAFGGQSIDGPAALRSLVVEGRVPMALERATPQSGCTPSECIVQVEGLTIVPDKRLLRQGSSRPIRLVQHLGLGGRELPAMDWTPTDVYTVSQQGQRWGLCLEFSHSGPGRSGSFQRWTSIVLLPWLGQHPARTAHRFVGYWASCDQLTSGTKPEQLVLGLVELGRADRLSLVNYTCDRQRCQRGAVRRAVSVLVEGDAKVLRVD